MKVILSNGIKLSDKCKDGGYGSWAVKYPNSSSYLCKACWERHNKIFNNDYEFPTNLPEYTMEGHF